MTPGRWAQIRQIFDAALERTSDERIAYLGRACAGDDDLRHQVEDLLSSHSQSDGFLAETADNLHHHRPTGGDNSGDHPEGYRVGSYQLLRCIGRGGMGSVWVAARVDHEYEKKVAIKIVKRGMDSREILRRFRVERQVLAGLDHPNIARLIDGGSTPDGLPYLVMEYVDGTPIDAYCESHHSSITERLQLFRKVCGAVQYAHQNLVVHRDIKMGNILVTADGTPKLLDFGIAKLIRSELMEAQTQLDQRPMTPDYASPEQVRGEPITTATDVYSLGVLLYRLITGRSPYQMTVRSLAAIQKAICEDEPRRPSTVILTDATTTIAQETQKLEETPESRDKARKRLRKKLAGDLDMIVLKALRKEPQRRYASVEQFSEDIRRYLEGRPVIARSDTFGYRFTKFLRRNTAGVAATAAIALALIVATIVSVYYWRQADRRFEEGRKLARFVLFDLDPAIQSGVTSARQKVIGEALNYLTGMQREAGKDVSLQHDIVQGYLQIGDAQGNPYQANLGNSAGAAANYQKAFEIAQTILQAHPNDAQARRDVANAEIKRGDLLAFGGDRAEALKRYLNALNQFEALTAKDTHNLGAQQDVMGAALKVGIVQDEMGDLQGALASFSRYLQIAEGLQAIEAAGAKQAGEETRRAVASGYDHVGDNLVKTGAREEGLSKLRKSVAVYQDLFDGNRENPKARRSLSASYQVLGDALKAAVRWTEAIDAYQRSVELAETQLKADPQDRQSQRDLTVGLGRLVDALLGAHEESAARAPTERALQLLKPMVAAPGASEMDMQQYCWLLVTTPFPDLKNPAAALRYAKQAVSISNGTDPGMLDTLARARAAVGDFAGAIETEEKAQALLPAGVQSDLRKEIDDNLALFRQHATRAANPSAAKQ